MATTHFVWDVVSDACLAEVDGQAATTAVYTSEPVSGGRLVSQRRGSASTYYQFDGDGSTRDLSGASEESVSQYAYTAYGEPVFRLEGASNPYQYRGRFGYYREALSGTIIVDSGGYSPSIGRWLSARVPRAAGGASRPTAAGKPYSYLGNNPGKASARTRVVVGSSPTGFDQEVDADNDAGCRVTLVCWPGYHLPFFSMVPLRVPDRVAGSDDGVSLRVWALRGAGNRLAVRPVRFDSRGLDQVPSVPAHRSIDRRADCAARLRHLRSRGIAARSTAGAARAGRFSASLTVDFGRFSPSDLRLPRT